MRRIIAHSIALVTLALTCVSMVPPVAYAQTAEEQFVKLTVALIYRSSKLVTWPDNAFESSSSDFVIGVLGNESLFDELVKLTKDRDVDGHTIRVLKLDGVDAIDGVHVLYVDGGNVTDFLAIDQTEREDQPVLTVSDSQKFVRDGGILRIFQKNSKPKLEVNVDAAKRQRLKISSQLLKNADVIRDTN